MKIKEKAPTVAKPPRKRARAVNKPSDREETLLVHETADNSMDLARTSITAKQNRRQPISETAVLAELQNLASGKFSALETEQRIKKLAEESKGSIKIVRGMYNKICLQQNQAQAAAGKPQ